MKPDIVEFVESTLGLELTEFQKKLLRTYYEHKDEMTEPLYLNVGRSQRKVIIEALKTCMEVYGMAIDERYFYGQHGIDIEKAYSERILGHCKDCKYFEYDSVAKVDGIPSIVAHEICSKWGDGCKTKEDGYCFLFKSKESEE